MVFLFIICCPFWQQTVRTEKNLSTVEVVIPHFKMQSAQIETIFMNDQQNLSYIDSLIMYATSSIDSVTIVGFPSPGKERPVTPPSQIAVSELADTIAPLTSEISGIPKGSEIPVSKIPTVTAPEVRTYPFNVALKTNLIYDLALLPNIEAEIYFRQHWSINLEFQIAWWKNLQKDYYYQIWTAGSEIRYWLGGSSTFKGHYVGAYISTALYDLKYKNEGYRSDYCYSAGVSWGYVWPIGKRIALEAGLSLGYITTQYKKYLRYEPLGAHYYYTGTDRTGYFGPTKAKVALVWRFDTKKKNKNVS